MKLLLWVFFSGVALCLEVIETTCPSHVPNYALSWLGPPKREYTDEKYYYRICQGLTSTPGNIPKKAVRVYIRGNTIETLKVNDFSGLDQCYYLGLIYNEVTSIELGAFTGLNALRTLSLSNNKLTQIKSGLFSGLIKLEGLYISSNELTRIEPGMVSGITSLEDLKLNDNNINHIEPGSFSGLVTLWLLEIKDNQLIYIASGLLSGLVTLLRLNLSGNELSHIEYGVFTGLPSLRDIYLNANKISHIESGAFSQLPAFKYLFLQFNDLTTISWTMFTSGNININHPTELYLYIRNNPFHCNTSMCWIQQGQLEGWIMYPSYNGIRVDCANSDQARHVRNEVSALPDTRDKLYGV